jgi:pimeloyl-ACP methyl ester carboxylesterase
MMLHASEAGEGPPVCLLHGLFGRSQNLAPLARRLASRYRVISPDLRNHGASPHAAGMDYAAMADDVLQTLAGRHALPVHALGHSMGGKVVMMMALTAPAQVGALIVADIAPVPYAHQNARVARALQGLPLTPGLSRREADAALAGSIPDPAIRGFLLQNLIFGDTPGWRIGLDEISAGMSAIEGWPTLPAPSRYDGPTLFVAADRSDYIQPGYDAVIGALFPAATRITLADAGHWLHADQPDAFATVVEHFLASHDEAVKKSAAFGADTQ